MVILGISLGTGLIRIKLRAWTAAAQSRVMMAIIHRKSSQPAATSNVLMIRRRPYQDTVAILRLSRRPEFASCVFWRDCIPVVSVGPREELDKDVAVAIFCLAAFGCAMAGVSILMKSSKSWAHAASIRMQLNQTRCVGPAFDVDQISQVAVRIISSDTEGG